MSKETERLTCERNSTANSKIIGNFICERRKVLGMTQIQLADRLCVTNKAISKWETGEGYPDITIVLDLSRVLCTTADELLNGRMLHSDNAQKPNETENQCPEVKTPTMILDDKRSKNISSCGHLCILTGLLMAVLTFLAVIFVQYYGYGELNEVPMYVVALIVLVVGFNLMKISYQKQNTITLDDKRSANMSSWGYLCIITGLLMVVLTFLADAIVQFYDYGELNKGPIYVVALAILIVGFSFTKISYQKQTKAK